MEKPIQKPKSDKLSLLPQVAFQNNEQFLQIVRKLDPELFLIHTALTETSLNPMLIPAVVRVLGNLCLGTGWGRISIFMENGMVTQIKAEESVLINKTAVTGES